MAITVFHQSSKRVIIGIFGRKTRYGHTYGSPVDYSGLAAFRRQPPVHVLFRLNADDPEVGVKLPKAQWLPLLCAIRYGACEVGYRVDALRETGNDREFVVHQATDKLSGPSDGLF